VVEKLGKLEQGNSMMQFGGGMAPQMESQVLMYNIQRIIQESERLKKDVFEKSARIEQQNEKIAELLDRNQKYVEESNLILEQRNDSFKQTTAQAQTRVLELEQEKIARQEELTKATEKLSALSEELTALKAIEKELRAEFVALKEEHARVQSTAAALQASEGGSAGKIEELNRSFKEERQARKEIEKKLASVEEEFLELQTEHAAASKKLESAKKKAAKERGALEEEIDDLKSQHDTVVEDLKRKLRKAKQSSETSVSTMAEKLESELISEWKGKLDKAVAAAEVRWQSKYQLLEEDYNDLLAKASQSSRSDDDARVRSLQAEVVTLQQQLAQAAASAGAASGVDVDAAYQRGLAEGKAASGGAKGAFDADRVKTLMQTVR
jgi:FK506-binding protein 15